MIDRWPKRGLVLASVAVIAILLTAVIDHQITSNKLPEVGPFTPDRPAHSDPAVAEEERLRDGFIARAWLYSLALIGVVAALAIAGLRSAPRDRWHALFTDLGVASVCAVGLAVVISINGPPLFAETTKEPIWVAPVLMILGAGVGSLLTLRRREQRSLAAPYADLGERARGQRDDRSPWGPATGEPHPLPRDARGGSPDPVSSRIGLITIVLAVLTVLLLAILGTADEGAACGDRGNVGLGVVLLGALGGGAAVGVCGIVALVARRWVLSLLSFLFAAMAGIFAVGATIGPCLS